MTEWAITLHDSVVKQFSLPDGAKVVIGRGADADIVLDNTAISRHHLVLENRSGLCIVGDLGSLNGTFLNNHRVKEETVVTPQDRITFGKFVLAGVGDKPEAKANLSSSSSAPMDLDEETVFVKPGAAIKPPQKTMRPGQHNLQVISGKASPTQINLDGKTSIQIGKDPASNLVVGGWLVARAQCYIVSRNEKYFIVPQRSWTGTYLNGSKISTENRLHKDDIITIRSTKIRFS